MICAFQENHSYGRVRKDLRRLFKESRKTGGQCDKSKGENKTLISGSGKGDERKGTHKEVMSVGLCNGLIRAKSIRSQE